jgi:hypothetical protein
MRVPVKPALLIGDELITVPATRAESIIINDALSLFSDEQAAYAAARGVNIYDFKTPDYERIVTRTPLMPPNR